MHQEKKPKKALTQEDFEEVDLSLHEIIDLASREKLLWVFGFNGVDKNIPIRRIKSQLTGTYDNSAEEVRCNFNTAGIQSIIGGDYIIYTKPKPSLGGLRYYLYIEPKAKERKK